MVFPEADVVEAPSLETGAFAGFGAAIVGPEAAVAALEAVDAGILRAEAFPTVGFWAGTLGLDAAPDVVEMLAAPSAALVDLLPQA